MRKFNVLTVLLAVTLLFLPLHSTAAVSSPDTSIQLLPATTPGWTFTGEQAQSYLGLSWMPAGDVNGDRYDDLIFGAYAYDTATLTNAGRRISSQARISGWIPAVRIGSWMVNRPLPIWAAASRARVT
jgi:hypothetical protein